MKLRTTRNSIRIRIRKSELELLSKEGLVEESVNFGNQIMFKFGLTIHSNIEQTVANLKDNYLNISLPSELANQWINSNRVGIEINHPISENEQLHLLIEKDFPCAHRPEEDKSDTFTELAAENQPNCP